MKLKSNYIIREISGRQVMVPLSVTGKEASKIVSLSASTAWLLEQLAGREFTPEEATELVCERYEVEKEVAFKDIQAMLEGLKDAEFLED